MQKPRKNLTGKTSGKLTVTGFAEFRGHDSYWHCDCSCGKTNIVLGRNITSGRTESCGCGRVENARKLFTKHGLRGTKSYRTLMYMKARCYNKNNESYHNYGGRGIKVCDRWLNSVENFHADMGDPKGMTIERIDNDGDYTPENCKWATRQEQNKNRRSNRYLEYLGVEKTMLQWANIFGIKKQALWHRLKSGMSVTEALDKPLRGA